MSPSHFRSLPLLLLALSAAPPAGAQTPASQPQTAEGAARSIVTDPLEDTNIQKKKIPEALERIIDNPYARTGTRSCSAIADEIRELDSALGSDFDAPPADKPGNEVKAIGVAKGIALGFIPARGLIRELSGANKAEERHTLAVYAGVARRAFLKGIGAQRGCKPPAAPKA